MLFLVLKTLHVGFAVLFLGAGLASAFMKVVADRNPDLRVVAWSQRQIVLADWVFTVPAGVGLPATGLWLAHLYGIPWTSGYVAFGLLAWVTTGLLWLPAAWLQIRMRRDAEAAVAAGTPLPARFHRDARIWLVLGAPAFAISVYALWVMVAKSAPFP